jgi:DNA-binding NtrC family response regulator
MAHVLVAHADHGVREVVAQALREEAGHHVISVSDAAVALATLCASSSPVVALVDERLSPVDRLGGILHVASHDQAGGQFSRHRYILISALPYNLGAKERHVLSRLGAPLLSQPFELDALLQTVDDAAATLAGRGHPQPAQRRATPALVAAMRECLAPRARAYL